MLQIVANNKVNIVIPTLGIDHVHQYRNALLTLLGCVNPKELDIKTMVYVTTIIKEMDVDTYHLTAEQIDTVTEILSKPSDKLIPREEKQK